MNKNPNSSNGLFIFLRFCSHHLISCKLLVGQSLLTHSVQPKNKFQLKSRSFQRSIWKFNLEFWGKCTKLVFTMLIIIFYWYWYHFWHCLMIKIFIDTIIDTYHTNTNTPTLWVLCTFGHCKQETSSQTGKEMGTRNDSCKNWIEVLGPYRTRSQSPSLCTRHLSI